MAENSKDDVSDLGALHRRRLQAAGGNRMSFIPCTPAGTLVIGLAADTHTDTDAHWRAASELRLIPQWERAMQN